MQEEEELITIVTRMRDRFFPKVPIRIFFTDLTHIGVQIDFIDHHLVFDRRCRALSAIAFEGMAAQSLAYLEDFERLRYWQKARRLLLSLDDAGWRKPSEEILRRKDLLFPLRQLHWEISVV